MLLLGYVVIFKSTDEQIVDNLFGLSVDWWRQHDVLQQTFACTAACLVECLQPQPTTLLLLNLKS